MDPTLFSQLRTAGRTALNLFFAIVAVLVLVYILSGIYSVANNEVGVHQRFGKIIDPHVPPGMHYALPWPFDRVDKVPFPKVERIDINDFSQRFTFGEGLTFTSLTGLGTYVVTGDNNLVNVECVIQYEVTDPVAYLYNLGDGVENVENSVRRFLIEMACNTIVHCFAELGVDDVLTIKRDYIVSYVKKYLQKRLDAIESGLAVTFFEIKELKPPQVVQDYFDDVINAKQDKETTINEAVAYQNEEIPAAKGRAARLLTEGQGYYEEVVKNAEGEAKRFLELLTEYHKEKELTRYRLYMESVQEVLAGVEQWYVLDAKDGKTPAAIKLFK